MRRALLVAVAGAVVLLTAGCTVPRAGVTGIGVDAQGNPVGYIQVCHDHIDAVRLYTDEDGDLGEWTSASPTTAFATWSLANPTDPWTSKVPLGVLEPETRYSMYGGTYDNSWSTTHVSFTLQDLASMEPGEVRWAGKAEEMVAVETVTSEGEFRSRACQPNKA